MNTPLTIVASQPEVDLKEQAVKDWTGVAQVTQPDPTAQPNLYQAGEELFLVLRDDEVHFAAQELMPKLMGKLKAKHVMHFMGLDPKFEGLLERSMEVVSDDEESEALYALINDQEAFGKAMVGRWGPISLLTEDGGDADELVLQGDTYWLFTRSV